MVVNRLGNSMRGFCMSSDPKSEKRERPVDIRAREYNEARALFQKQQGELAEREKAQKLDQTGTEKG